jgi:hypothetical protein
MSKVPINSQIDNSDEFSVDSEISFDTTENMDLLGFWADDPSKLDPASLIKEGVLKIGAGSPFQGFQVHPTFQPGDIVQVRLRTSQNGCFPVMMNMSSNQPDEGEELIQVVGCVKDRLLTQVRANSPDSVSTYGRIKQNGKITVTAGKWLDIIFWLHPDGDRAYVFLGNGKDFSYGSISLPDDWRTNDAHLQVSEWPGTPKDYIEVDFVRWGQGSIEEYLTTYLPEYKPVKESVATFMADTPQSFPELSKEELKADDPDETATVQTQPTKVENDSSQPEKIGEGQDQPQETLNQPNLSDPFEVVKTFLNEPQILFGEDAGGMKNNQAGQFGPGSDKKVSDDESFVSFIGKNDPVWTPLNTPLDQFGEKEPGRNQAIYFKFQADPPDKPYFTFMSPMEFNISFWEGGKPEIAWMIEAKKASFQNKSFALEKNKWYFMLMAIDKDGKFVSSVWEKENPNVMSRFSEDLSSHPSGEKYKNVSWKFVLGTKDPNSSINLESYKVLTFDSVNETVFQK